MPSIEIKANILYYWCSVLSKAGYGSVRDLKKLNSEEFFNLLWYEKFINEYQAETVAINRRN